MRLVLDTRGPKRQILAGLIELPGASRMTGVSIGADALRWLTAVRDTDGSLRVHAHGSIPLPHDTISSGVIRDTEALSDAIAEMGKACGASVVHGVLPDESAHVFALASDAMPEVAEFEIARRLGVAPERMYYDMDRTDYDSAVGVFPRALAKAYVDAFSRAGVRLSSLEIAARAAARSLAYHFEDVPVALLVDLSGSRAVISEVRHGLTVSNAVYAIEDAEDAAQSLRSEEHTSELQSH